MIRISKVNNTVNVVMGTGIGYEITLVYQRSSEMDAALLRNQLIKAKEDFICAVKEQAYNQGWEDKLKKRKKQRKFLGYFFK